MDKRRLKPAIVTAVVLAAVVITGLVVAQKRRQSSSRSAGSKQSTTASRRVASSTSPIRPADPNLAPQAAVDEALYVNEEFFGSTASVARPYSDALGRLDTLLEKYPKDARLHLNAARLSERLGQFDKSAKEMETYADLKKRSPDALRRLADFYHHREMPVEEVKTLQQLAKSLSVDQRGPIYKRAAAIVRAHSLKEFKPADFFAELVAADPSNIQPVQDYVEELRLANNYKDALAVLASFQPKFPSELAYFLKTRAQILEATGDRHAAEDVYSSAFDPTWPHQVSADYYDLLRRFGRYRIVRRGLQDKVRAGATDLQTIGRLFSIYAYEGNYAQASLILRNLETRRAGRSAQSSGGGDNNRTVASASAAWPPAELETVAAMFSSIGAYDQSSRYLYTLYLEGGLAAGSQSRDDALYRLFNVMLDSAGAPTRVAAGDISFYKDVATVDEHPGFMNGVLSLILSGTDPSTEFATEEKAAAGYFNRAFAYRIFTAYKQEYPSSPRLGDMYLGVINVFSSLGEYKLAIEAGREFQQRFPKSPSYMAVSLRIADCYVSLNDRTKERAVLAELLERAATQNPKGLPLVPVAARRWSYGITPQIDKLIDRIRYNIEAYSDTYDPTEGGSGSASSGTSTDNEEASDDEEESEQTTEPSQAQPRTTTYSQILERYVSSLAADDKKTETVAFFWGQIKEHPKEEGLYERFLSWLGQAQLINEQLAAYNSAIRQFQTNTWYHRLARWYVREKRGKELNSYSHELINVFDEDEITEYLLRFAGYGATAAGDDMNWDEALAYNLYSYAHNRFPDNLFFVRGMLTYLEKHDRAEWEKLSVQYYFADRSISNDYLAWLSGNRQLRDRYAQAVARISGGATPGAGQPQASAGAGKPATEKASSLEAVPQLKPASAEPGALTTYRIFAADSAIWLSHYDKAVDVYRDLIAAYPGTAQYVTRFADLARSFGQQNEGFYDESAQALAHMAEIYPSDHSYRIKAGEAYAERSEFNLAGQQWDKLVDNEPGNRNTYLEVATVYWDYYQFDQAIRVLKDLRTKSGDPTIYAYRLGAVYEGKNDIDSAIAEYVKVLPEPGDGRDTVTKRLAQLSRRKGLAEKIAAAYERARAERPNDWQLVIGYALYQVEREQTAEALAILRAEVLKSRDVAFLQTMRDLFQNILRPEDQQLAITRLAAVARDEHEAMMYNLQLASFLEHNNQRDGAIKIIDKLVADYPTNVGVIEDSAEFYWRAKLRDKAIDLYKRTLNAARGSYRRRFTLELAQHQTDAGRPADAETTLRAFYADNQLDSEVFSALIRTLGVENKQSDLTALYQQALKDVRQSGLTGDDARARIAQLRAGMITTLTDQGKYQEAVDQYIEIINSFPEDEDQLNTAIEYADRYNLTGRLIAYYEKLTKQAFKNYRWQVVLARLYESRENLAGASEQYRLAVVNEPQRSDLRFTLASTLTRQRRYDEAIATLKDGFVLAGRDPKWLVEIARIQVLQGKRDDAVQTMRQALASKQNSSPSAQFALASQLAAWGFNAEAAGVYDQVFTRLPKTLKDDYVDPSQVGAYVRVLIKTAPAASVFKKMEEMRATYLAIKENSQDTDSDRAGSIVTAIDQSMNSDFGQGVIDYASPAEVSELSSAIRAATDPLTAYSDKERLVRYLGIARGAGLVDDEEHIYVQLKDAAFKARTKPEDSSFYSELGQLIAFYNRRSAFTRAAELLTAEYSRDPFKDRFDYNNQVAIEYRLAGDTGPELDSLRRAYADQSGSGISAHSDWVERYLDLLYSSGKRDELQRIASSYSPYQLQLINFLIGKNEIGLARTAVANAKQSPAWVASRNAEIGLFSKDVSPETEHYFKTALDPKTIGEMLGRHVDASQTLLGDDWGIEARNYGYWLGLQKKRLADSRRFLAGEIERHPTSAQPQLELAGFFLDRKDTTRAADHTALAEELAPGDKNVAAMRGAIALARGDRKGALDAWSAIIARNANVADAQFFLRLTADHGLLAEALPYLGSFMVAHINQTSPDKSDNSVEAIKPLVRDIAARTADDPTLARQAAGFFQNVEEQAPGDVVLGRMLIEEKLLPESVLAFFYRTVHQRLSDVAASVVGTADYENGYNTGIEVVNPARDLSEWRRRLLDYLIRNGSLNEARLLVATIEKEQSDLKVMLKARAAEDESGASGFVDHYDWLPLASALIELRGGGDTAAVVSQLRAYCGLGNKATPSNGTLNPHCLKAYALLVAEHKDAEADALLYDAYSDAVRSRHADDASLVGMAELEARRGKPDEASKLLKRMVQRSTDNLHALLLAAESATRMGDYADAIDFRQQIATANPTDSVNAVELARVIQASGKPEDSVDRLIALLSMRTTPNTVRAQAAEFVGEIVRSDKSQAARAIAALDPRVASGDAGAALARAAIAEAVGSTEDERAALAHVNTGSLAAIAQLKLGLLSLGAGRDSDALTAFERAMYVDPDGAVTDAISFRVTGPRLNLIGLYARMGRDLAAVRLAEDQGSGQVSLKPLISSTVSSALTSGRGQPQEFVPVFEPPLDVSRTNARGLKTVAELRAAAAAETHPEILAALVQAASRLHDYDKAIGIERLRASVAVQAAEKSTIEKSLAQMIAAEQARQATLASLLRVDVTNTTKSLYADRALEK